MHTPPDTDLARITRWCRQQSTDGTRVTMTRRGLTVTLLEGTEYDGEWLDTSVARIRYDEVSHAWTLFWFDSNSRAHRYDLLPPHRPIGEVLAEIDDDPTDIFWG